MKVESGIIVNKMKKALEETAKYICKLLIQIKKKTFKKILAFLVQDNAVKYNVLITVFKVK